MTTNREALDAGYTLNPEDAEQEAQALEFARALYRVLGRDTATKLGTAIALEPTVEQGIAVSGNSVELPLGALTVVQVTAGAKVGAFELLLVGAPGSGQVLVEVDASALKLSFNAGDAVTEIAVMQLRAPAELLAALGEDVPVS